MIWAILLSSCHLAVQYVLLKFNSYSGTVTVVCSDYFLTLDALLMNQDTRQDMCEADTVN